ncbi:GIY-YIG nuclease family protein [Rhizobium leguminosarum]|uniref:GIY-YIG nuclease family protein n=1 Tax=Rhizobium leguminosarum TaxID=384 RepID=UPI000489B8A4|nr:GIY-YIG nuclease family protein [Rhizobium leguminosarum]
MTVYFIRRKGDPQGLIKIGVSINLDRRLYAMQTSNPEGFDLLCAVEGGKGIETYFHERFADDRVTREWFKPSTELLELASKLERVGVSAIPEFARGVDDVGMTPSGSSANVNEAAKCLEYMADRRVRHGADLEAAYLAIAGECGITFWAVKHIISKRAKSLSVDKFDGIKRAYLNCLREEKMKIEALIERESSQSVDCYADELSMMDEINSLAEKVRQAKQGR